MPTHNTHRLPLCFLSTFVAIFNNSKCFPQIALNRGMFPPKTKEDIAHLERHKSCHNADYKWRRLIRRGKKRYQGTIQITLMRLACLNRKLRPVCCYTQDSDRCHSGWHIVVRPVKKHPSICLLNAFVYRVFIVTARIAHTCIGSGLYVVLFVLDKVDRVPK